ncbi:MAG: insulinase family protein [Gemmatimonadota bacterium]|nr:MAG: insulinase family protein [Gemmatimonadota bacterium]
MPWTDDVAKQVLSNGLTLLVQRNASAPVVAVVTHVKAGYFDEPDEWVGIAHVLEHMYFKGTARRGPGDIARETQLVGGYINAGTIYDKTVYYTVLPSASGGLETALDVQADALMHSALDGDELRRELEVIIQEAKRKLDTPGAVAAEGLYALLFRVHRMRRWRIGTEDGLRRLTRDDVWAYYAGRYTPGRVIVGIAGDLDVDRALHIAADTYGAWDRPTRPVEGSPPEPDAAPPGLRVERGDVERPLVNVGWRTVGTLHPDAAALDMTAMILGAGRGSRLYRGVRAPGLAASAGAGHYTPTEVGVFEVGLEGEAARLDAATEHAVKLVQALRGGGPEREEVERARALVATQWARRLESMDGRAAVLCEAEALGDYRLAEELYRRDMEVTAADVRRVSEQYLDPATASGFFYLPEGGSTRFEGGWPPGEATQRAELAAVSAPPVAGRRALPAAGEETRYPGGVVHRSYAGADVLVRSKRGAGLATVLVHVPGVTERETGGNAGISWLLARTAIRGAGGLSAEELAQAAEMLGGGLAPSVGAETLGWGMTVRADAVRHAAELLRIVAHDAALTGEDVAVERALQASDARRARDDMFRHPLQRVLGQGFPTDAYGLPALGDPDLIGSIDPAAVRQWGADLARHRAVVVAVGDLREEDLHDALEPLAGWPAERVAPAGSSTPVWQAGRAHETRRKEQTALAMAFPAAPFASAERYPVTVLGALLSGLAGRLFDELREKRSLAYTVAVLPWLARRAGAVLSYIATSPGRESEAREAMLSELGRVVTEPPSVEELERARNYAAGLVEVRQQSGRAVAGEILEAWVHGTVAELHETAARLRAVHVEDVIGVAQKVFDPDRRAEYVVRGGG